MPAEQTDVDIVLRCFDAFMGRDIEALLAMLAADVEVKSLMTEAERVHYQGHQGAREWMTAVFDIFPDWTPRPAEVQDLGAGAVLVRIDMTATAVASGVPIDQILWEISTLEDGKVTWFGFYRTGEDALAALEQRR
jgi:ketosteroid isomerase-like protein